MRRCVWLWLLLCAQGAGAADGRPNFLFIITDDQSWEHTSRAGYPRVQTPAFDRIANQGMYFRRAFVSAPSCTESRSAILSGQHFWQTDSGAALWGQYPAGMPNFMHLLAARGYATAYTGKGWGPGFVDAGMQPTGSEFRQHLRKIHEPYVGVAGYSADFEAFLDQRDAARPFFFWAGLFEPHRDYIDSDRNRFDGVAQDASWPAFMPYNGRSQRQLTLYLEEVEFADAEAGRLLAALERRGLLDTTVVIYTSDNGMPFAGAKANLYRHGIQVPLAIRWPSAQAVRGGESDALVSLVDLAPTVLDLAGVPVPAVMAGQSLRPLLSQQPARPWAGRDAVLVGFERHVPDARPDFSTYPMRGLVTREWLYIRNYKPQRWPQGNPEAGYKDAFMAHLLTYKGKEIEPFFTDLLRKRPARELYRWGDPPGAASNKAADPALQATVAALEAALDAGLRAAHDPGVDARDYFMRFAKDRRAASRVEEGPL